MKVRQIVRNYYIVGWQELFRIEKFRNEKKMKKTVLKQNFILFGILYLFCFGFYGIRATNGEEVTERSQETIIYLNEKKLTFTEEFGLPFIDESNRTQIPVRSVMTAFGAKIDWNGSLRVVTVRLDGNVLEIPIDKPYFVRNKIQISHDTSARIVGNRTFVPLRALMEAVGSKVVFDKNAVKITYHKKNTSVKRLPNFFDLREYNRVSPVKDQKTSGACWAFASLGAIESALMPWEEFDFSEDNMSLGHGYNLSQAQGGDYMIALSYLTRGSGPVLEKEDPFDGIVNQKATAVKRVQEAYFLPKDNRLAIKRAVLLYGGVQSSLYLDQLNRFGDSEYYDPEKASYYYDGNRKINHDIVIVGWDDFYSKENFRKRPKSDGAYLCKNSFGTGFGNDGYFYISYEDKRIGTNAIAYTKIENTNNFKNIYQSDMLGYLKRAGYGEDTAYFSNVYTPKGKENLKAVSFYALEPNSSYEIFLVPNFTGAGDFGRMESLAKGKFNYAGYYTVNLQQTVPVQQKFAIVVRIVSPGAKHPIATEAKGTAAWAEVDLSDGEGYISYDGKKWLRAEEHLEGNVCLKAFTNP